MSIIHLLDEVTANQIAAGEVIERPASVIKELVENAIDAKADNISIYLEDSGTKSIKIIDNGIGMSCVDAVKAFQRHATSKIKGISDLEQLTTLGFRGEALASISSIARVELVTKRSEDISATKINIEAGKLISTEETASSVGTSIKVKDLFYNTPARKKNLKTNQRELSVTNELIHKLSLAYPSVGITLYSNSKLIFTTAKGLELKQRLFDVYGSEIAKEMLEFEAINNLFSVKGFIGKSTISRNSRSHQAIFINNRFVKSSLISKAVEDGYHTYLMVNRYPIFVLHIEVNPRLVDVNVHPTKMEVRFDQEQVLYELIKNQVQLSLGQKIWISQKTSYQPKEQVEQINFQFNKEQNNTYNDYSTYKPKMYIENNSNNNIQDPMVKNQTIKDTDNILHVSGQYEKIKETEKLPNLTPIGQINASYIVCQGEDGLYLIDQHAAHERILYEQLLAQESQRIPFQQMLIPYTLELKAGYSQLLIENIVLFRDLGFIIEHFGGDTFIIRGVPNDLKEFNERFLLLDLLNELKCSSNIDKVKIKEKMLIQIACKSAIKAGQRLESEEIITLLERLNQQKNPFTCPHGRPTIIKISSYELDKRFKRIV